MVTKERIAQSLLAARKKSGLKQKEVAQRLGNFSDKTISTWEKGISQPDAEPLLKLCEIYGFATINELLGYSVSGPTLSTEILNHDEQELVNNYRGLDSGCRKIVYCTVQQLLAYIHKSENKKDAEFGTDYNFDD